MNLTKVDYQISPYHHSVNPAALRTPYIQPTTSKCSSFETDQYNPPHLSVSADRGQSPLSVCHDNFVSYDTSSSRNLIGMQRFLLFFVKLSQLFCGKVAPVKIGRSCEFLQ
jgi:hypothetical protein